jgi:hypothetical protein
VNGVALRVTLAKAVQSLKTSDRRHSSTSYPQGKKYDSRRKLPIFAENKLISIFNPANY